MVTQSVEALRSNLVCRGFDSRWRQWDFSLTYRPGRTVALESTVSKG
jgi:hypothetical protein